MSATEAPKRSPLLGQFFRWLCYFAWSYVMIGIIFFMMIHQITPYLLFGLPAAIGLSFIARWFDWSAFHRKAHFLIRLAVIVALVAFQFYSWRYVYFFRDPERTIPEEPAILCPADGFVVYIRPVLKGTVPLAIKGKASIPLREIIRMERDMPDSYIIGIYMTPMSVHVNRSPINGVVKDISYYRGAKMFSMAMMGLRTGMSIRPFEFGSDHIIRNERESVVIEGPEFPVILTRIADPYVDKIVTWKNIGDPVKQGEKIGLIKMGSQADVIFPSRVGDKRVRIFVKEGDYVYAGSTILATYDE